MRENLHIFYLSEKYLFKVLPWSKLATTGIWLILPVDISYGVFFQKTKYDRYPNLFAAATAVIKLKNYKVYQLWTHWWLLT